MAASKVCEEAGETPGVPPFEPRGDSVSTPPGAAGCVALRISSNTASTSRRSRNPEKARAIRPDNVIKAQPPADPRQGWIVKEEVTPSDTPKDRAQRTKLLQNLQGIPDVQGNLMWGTTADNPIPRWILIE
jgi:hypothetical protein